MSERFKGGVMVTGSTGFVGGSLAERLYSDGENVIPVSRSEGEIAGIIGIRRMDSTNLEEVTRTICKYKPQYIYDFAGWSKPSESKDDPKGAELITVRSLENLFIAISKAQIHDNTYKPKQIVIATSVAAFGPGRVDKSGRQLSLNEDSGWRPNSEYGTLKATATDLAIEFGQKYGVNVIAAIQANAGGSSEYFGISQRKGFIVPDNIERVINITKGKAEEFNERGEPILRTGPADQYINMTSVDQMVEAYIRLGKIETREKVIVGASNSVQVKQIIKWIINASGMKIDHQYPEVDIANQYYDTTRLKNTIGFVPAPINEIDIATAVSRYRQKIQSEIIDKIV